MEYLTVALPSGRLLKPAIALFVRVGVGCPELEKDTRKLLIMCELTMTKFVITKPVDLAIYVEHGVADIGVVGKDALLEEQRDVYELLDLGFGFCRCVVAAPRENSARPPESHVIRVATKYPRIAEEYFRQKGVHTELIKLHGSVELAPKVGLAERVVDLTMTGKTLRENNLVEIDEIFVSSARLIVNRISLRTKSERVHSLVERIRQETLKK